MTIYFVPVQSDLILYPALLSEASRCSACRLPTYLTPKLFTTKVNCTGCQSCFRNPGTNRLSACIRMALASLRGAHSQECRIAGCHTDPCVLPRRHVRPLLWRGACILQWLLAEYHVNSAWHIPTEVEVRVVSCHKLSSWCRYNAVE